MIPLSELFEIRYGHSLELNRLKLLSPADGGIPFVSRKMGDNGISAYVSPIEDIEPAPSGELSCALSGNGVLSTFLQEKPYYTAFHVARLKPLVELTTEQLLYYCACINANRYRYSYGRQANRTLKNILVPELSEVPHYVVDMNVSQFQGAGDSLEPNSTPTLDTTSWLSFELQQLFDIDRGTGPRRKDLNGSGDTPFVTSSDSNNGVTGVTIMPPTHKGNTIGVNRNGSVGEAFYQPIPFCSTEDVHIFTPKFELNPFIALFITTLLRREKYRFGYGRKWGIKRMKTSVIRLPVTMDGIPDWDFMERYIKTLPYSSQVIKTLT